MMKERLVRHATKINILAGLLRLTTGILIGLIATRILYSALGESDFGIFIALGNGGVFMMVLSSAFAGGARRQMGFAVGRNDSAGAKAAFETAFAVFLSFALLLAFLGSFFKAHVLSILSLPEARRDTVELLYWFALGNYVIGCVQMPFRAALDAAQAQYLISGWEIITIFVNLLALIFIVTNADDALLSAVVLQSGMGLATMIYVCAATRRYAPSIVSYRPRLHQGQAKIMIALTGWGLFAYINWMLRNDGMVFMLTVVAGVVSNGAFAVALRLANVQSEATFSILRTLVPKFALLAGRRDDVEELKLAAATSRYTGLVGIVIGTPLAIFAQPIARVWLGDSAPTIGIFVVCLTSAFALGLLSYGHEMILEARACGAYITLWATLPSAIATLILFAIAKTNPMPNWFLPVGQAVTLLTISFLVRPFVFGKKLAYPASEWFKNTARPGIEVAILGCLAGLVIRVLVGKQGFWSTVAGAAITGLLCLLAALWRGVRKEERIAFWEFVYRKFRGEAI